MKNPLQTTLMVLSTMTTIAATEAQAGEVVLGKPLILGASVSAGYQGVKGPGEVLALRHTRADQIRKNALNGRSGRDTMSQVNAKTVAGRSILIGVDLFFWDAIRSHPTESILAIKKAVSLAKAENVPIILGDVPGLFPQMQPHYQRLNQEIQTACAGYNKCRRLPLDSIFQKAMADGYIEYQGRRYEPHELIPDGLHLSPIASQYLADQMEEILEKANYFR